MPPQQAAVFAITGAAVVALDGYLHVYGRSLGVGIGLLLVPLLALLFARWVDGPVLYYRTWGRLHRLDLSSVTAVTLGKRTVGSTSVSLLAPALRKPLRLTLSSRGYVMPPLAREHLRGWLVAPHVRWDAAAAALFDGDATAGAASRRRNRLRKAVLIAVPICVAGVGVWLAYERSTARAIAGAPGYRTFGGPHGKPLAVGRPWGLPCRPVRFTVEEHVPDWIYTQAAAVVGEARRDGIDVTIETRRFTWQPGSLYYAPGQSPATTERVPIFVSGGTPPALPGGGREHIQLGWDAQLDADGRHETLTDAEGILWMKTIGGDPELVRRSVRQLIAMTQGIISTSRHDSGIARSSMIDRFSATDIAAMRLMSGCGKATGFGGRV
jgi:hypothetical protein